MLKYSVYLGWHSSFVFWFEKKLISHNKYDNETQIQDVRNFFTHEKNYYLLVNLKCTPNSL